MALRGAAARRYAQAAFEIARDNNTLDKWLADLTTLAQVFNEPGAVALMQNPKMTAEDQLRLATQAVSRTPVDPLAMNLLMIMAHRGRLALLPRVLEVFQEMYNRHKGIVVADITTAVPLDAAQQRRVAERLSSITGKSVQVRAHHDPRILGGIITRIGDELIDASVASRLETLAERLT